MTDAPKSPTCTCVNRSVKITEAVIFIRPNGESFATARDCPLHGMVDLTIYPKADSDGKDIVIWTG